MTAANAQPEEFHGYSKAYPPKNRKPLGLDVLDIHVVDGIGTLKLDPNRAAVIGSTGKLPVVMPPAVSLLSGKPAYLYRNSEGVEVALSEAELLRLFRLELRPKEFRKLRETFGAFHEIHDDFYNEESGAALQPMSTR